jgi:hypothetical protein
MMGEMANKEGFIDSYILECDDILTGFAREYPVHQ